VTRTGCSPFLEGLAYLARHLHRGQVPRSREADSLMAEGRCVRPSSWKTLLLWAPRPFDSRVQGVDLRDGWAEGAQEIGPGAARRDRTGAVKHEFLGSFCLGVKVYATIQGVPTRIKLDTESNPFIGLLKSKAVTKL